MGLPSLNRRFDPDTMHHFRMVSQAATTPRCKRDALWASQVRVLYHPPLSSRGVAVAQRLDKALVAGSNPAGRTIFTSSPPQKGAASKRDETRTGEAYRNPVPL